MKINSLIDLYTIKHIPERYEQEFTSIINELNQVRRKNFFILFSFIQFILLIISWFQRDTSTFSRIMLVSIIMIGITEVHIIFLSKLKNTIKKSFELPMLVILLLWSVIYSFIDHLSYGFNTIYIATLIFLSARHLSPKKVIIANIIAHSAFLLGLIIYTSSIEQLIIHAINSTIFVIISCLMNIRFYNNYLDNFLTNRQLQEESKKLALINEKIELEILEKNIVTGYLKDSEERLRSFLENSPSAVALLKADKIIYANQSTSKLTGYSLHELYNMPWWNLIANEMRDLLTKREVNRLLGKKEIQHYEAKITQKSGQVCWVDVSICSVNYESGIATLVNAYDITDRKKTQEQLEKLVYLKESMLKITQSIIGIDSIQAMYDLILEKALEVIDHTNVGSILILNQDNYLKIAAHKGFDPQKIEEFRLPLEQSFLWLYCDGIIDKTVIIDDVQALPKDKVFSLEKNPEEWSIGSSLCSPIIINQKLFGMINLDSNQKYVFTKEDIKILDYFRTQIEIALTKHILYEEVINLSHYDKLTNTYNRRYFETIFEKQLLLSERDQKKLSLILFDLNDLKAVNDRYGHLAGDELIKLFANVATQSIRQTDIFARYGGDEFIAVILEMPINKLTSRIEKITEELNQIPLCFEENYITCSFSYGIAQYPDDALNYTDLVRIADERMYAHKVIMKEKSI